MRFDLRGVPGGPDAAFAGFWWSHLRKADTARWLSGLARALRPGAVVAILDNRFVAGSSTPLSRRDAGGNTYQVRPLLSGETHEVLKNFPTAGELAEAMRPWAAEAHLEETPALLAPRREVPVTDGVDRLLARLDRLLDRFERLVPAGEPEADWSSATAFRWRKRGGRGWLDPVRHPHRITFADLKDIDGQKRRLRENTAQFVAGRPANNVLLTGARGTGKSSLVKAALSEYEKKGLRLIEVDKLDLVDLPDIVDLVAGREERFIVFCDDLSFEASEGGYKALKVVLDGTIAGSADNLLVYATSNRRHLMPEFMDENLEARHVNGEIHPGETTEEKISLSERFGLWLSFYPFDQEQYLDIATHWVRALGGRADEGLRAAALLWALERGSRSGRVAWQFARDYVGRPARARP